MVTWRNHCAVLTVLLITVVYATVGLADSPRYASVPALGVSVIEDAPIGGVHYIAIQLDQDLQGQGPKILFSEMWRGSAVGEQWKEGVRVATIAAANAVGQDSGRWTVTIRNRTYNRMTEGTSASGAIAVGIMAAWRGDTLQSDVVFTGAVTLQGNIEQVEALPSKFDGAANAHMRTMLVPKGQARTSDWDLFEQGKQRNVTVIEVGTLLEAYELMVTPGGSQASSFR